MYFGYEKSGQKGSMSIGKGFFIFQFNIIKIMNKLGSLDLFAIQKIIHRKLVVGKFWFYESFGELIECSDQILHSIEHHHYHLKFYDQI